MPYCDAQPRARAERPTASPLGTRHAMRTGARSARTLAVMTRAWIAIILAPTIVGIALFGIFALIAVPIMVVITATIAVPLFLLFKRMQRLNWWHAFLSGAFCGVCYVLLDMLLSGPSWREPLTSNNVLYVGLGALIGIVFWWMGLFRNPSFPFVSRGFPFSFLLIIPIAIGGVLLNKSLRPTFHQGRVISISKQASGASLGGLATVRLSGGTTVDAEFHESWMDATIVGKCFHLSEGWSTLRLRRIYSLDSQLGGDVNDC